MEMVFTPARMKLLWLAVILETINIAMTERRPKVRTAAHYWLLVDGEDYPEVCYRAGIEPEYLRRKLRTRLKLSDRLPQERSLGR